MSVALEQRTWGWTRRALSEASYTRASPQWLLIGTRHTAGGPHRAFEIWQTGEIDLFLCKINGTFYSATALLWPEEVATGEIVYPLRVGIEPVLTLTGVMVGPGGPLDTEVSRALHSAGANPAREFPEFDPASLFRLAGLGPTPAFGDTPGVDLDAAPSTEDLDDAGRSDDPERDAVERRAVDAAKHWLRTQGWVRIVEKGKPYDLECFDVTGGELHVEVKGRSGSAALVMLTRNEVTHARDPRISTMLIVVRDIRIERTPRGAPIGRGGTLEAWPDWAPEEAHLRPYEYEYEVQRPAAVSVVT